ncbi:hypothetical protein CY0110_26078 [Crocosphaera chwakensis CCY0110]|uniref:DUF1822 domain-containing protein n=2 Tax=Crocosphaera TaxID=263510 RepID=A3IPA0_9CHRO|nr:hypothetical protein CY0110_26078 [Crocosphaera chwakensis CCY0110]
MSQMTANLIVFPDFDPNQFYLELSEDTLEGSWQQIDRYSSLSRRWQAYLHQVALTSFLNWLQEEQSIKAKVWPNRSALPSFLEVVDGTAIEFDGVRLLLLVTDSLDVDEMRVPQEWVDIPSWVADYYLAVQINPDDGYLRVFGYTTHQQLKTKGTYDGSDRVYYLSENDLIADLDLLWITRQLCPNEILQEPIVSLPPLPLVHAENLLIRLGQSSVPVPRLEIPFVLWGSLLEHDGWRRQLYEKRIGLTEQWSVVQWLETEISQVAQGLGWNRTQWQPSLVAARGESLGSSIVLSRQLVIKEQPYELRIVPKGLPEQRIWRFELWSSCPSHYIPRGMKLRLLTEDLQSFDNNEDIALNNVDLLFVEVSLGSGEGLIWEIEPFPDNYEREILRF